MAVREFAASIHILLIVLSLITITAPLVSALPYETNIHRDWEPLPKGENYAEYKIDLSGTFNVITSYLVTKTKTDDAANDRIIFTLYDGTNEVLASYVASKKEVADLNAAHKSIYFYPGEPTDFIDYMVVRLESTDENSCPALITEKDVSYVETEAQRYRGDEAVSASSSLPRWTPSRKGKKSGDDFRFSRTFRVESPFDKADISIRYSYYAVADALEDAYLTEAGWSYYIELLVEKGEIYPNAAYERLADGYYQTHPITHVMSTLSIFCDILTFPLSLPLWLTAASDAIEWAIKSAQEAGWDHRDSKHDEQITFLDVDLREGSAFLDVSLSAYAETFNQRDWWLPYAAVLPCEATAEAGAWLFDVLVYFHPIELPRAHIVSDKLSLVQGDAITFKADVEGGEPVGFSWESNVDGLLGNDESICPNLSSAGHLVTVTVTDKIGVKSTDSIFVKVYPREVELEEVEVQPDFSSLSWSESDDENFDSYEVHLSTEQNFSIGYSTRVAVLRRGSDAPTSYNLSNFAPDTWLSYRIVVRSKYGLESESNEVRKKTPIYLNWPTQTEKTWIELSWIYRDTPTSQMVLLNSTDGKAWSPTKWTLTKSEYIPDTPYTEAFANATELSPGTLYYFKIERTTDGAYSNAVNAMTKTNKPPVIESFTTADQTIIGHPKDRTTLDGVSASFTFSAHDDDGTIVEYILDFDGDKEPDVVRAHNRPEIFERHDWLYAAPGNYTVTLWVIDDAGGVAEQEVTVRVLCEPWINNINSDGLYYVWGKYKKIEEPDEGYRLVEEVDYSLELPPPPTPEVESYMVSPYITGKVTLSVDAGDLDGYVSTVEFYANLGWPGVKLDPYLIGADSYGEDGWSIVWNSGKIWQKMLEDAVNIGLHDLIFTWKDYDGTCYFPIGITVFAIDDGGLRSSPYVVSGAELIGDHRRQNPYVLITLQEPLPDLTLNPQLTWPRKAMEYAEEYLKVMEGAGIPLPNMEYTEDYLRVMERAGIPLPNKVEQEYIIFDVQDGKLGVSVWVVNAGEGSAGRGHVVGAQEGHLAWYKSYPEEGFAEKYPYSGFNIDFYYLARYTVDEVAHTERLIFHREAFVDDLEPGEVRKIFASLPDLEELRQTYAYIPKRAIIEPTIFVEVFPNLIAEEATGRNNNLFSRSLPKGHAVEILHHSRC